MGVWLAKWENSWSRQLSDMLTLVWNQPVLSALGGASNPAVVSTWCRSSPAGIPGPCWNRKSRKIRESSELDSHRPLLADGGWLDRSKGLRVGVCVSVLSWSVLKQLAVTDVPEGGLPLFNRTNTVVLGFFIAQYSSEKSSGSLEGRSQSLESYVVYWHSALEG